MQGVAVTLPPAPVAVIACNIAQAQDWAARNDLRPGEWFHVTDHRKLIGRAAIRYVETGQSWRHPDIVTIRFELDQLKRRGRATPYQAQV